MLISAGIAIRSRRRSAIGVLAILIAIALSVLVNAPAPARPLPVPYGNAEMLRVAVHDWNGSVDGANDYSCKPTRKHPNPVVLIGSTFLSDAVNWTALGPYLHNQGYCVYTLNYGRSRYYVPLDSTVSTRCPSRHRLSPPPSPRS